jgi:L-alanine-DL-glutamate epimerase-like enolase superfamily enzyme
MPNFLITEYFVNFEPIGNAIATTPFTVENSYITLPTAPGLGIDLDEAALTQRPYREHTLRKLRQPHEEA